MLPHSLRLALLSVFLALPVLSGCGYTLSDARRDLTTAEQAQIETVPIWHHYNVEHQLSIDTAGRLAGKPKATITDEINAYRAIIPKVEAAFTAFAAASKTTKESLNLYEAGKAGALTLAAAMAPALSAAAALYFTLKTGGLDVPALGKLIGIGGGK